MFCFGLQSSNRGVNSLQEILTFSVHYFADFFGWFGEKTPLRFQIAVDLQVPGNISRMLKLLQVL